MKDLGYNVVRQTLHHPKQTKKTHTQLCVFFICSKAAFYLVKNNIKGFYKDFFSLAIKMQYKIEQFSFFVLKQLKINKRDYDETQGLNWRKKKYNSHSRLQIHWYGLNLNNKASKNYWLICCITTLQEKLFSVLYVTTMNLKSETFIKFNSITDACKQVFLVFFWKVYKKSFLALWGVKNDFPF